MVVKIINNCMYTQARNCLFCLHIGSKLIYLYKNRNNWLYGTRIELFTPVTKFRLRIGSRN